MNRLLVNSNLNISIFEAWNLTVPSNCMEKCDQHIIINNSYICMQTKESHIVLE